MSMTSFQGGVDRPGSRGLSRKGTPIPGLGSAGGMDGAGASSPMNGVASAVSMGEMERIKVRIAEVERILMEKELTMRNLGDPEDIAASMSQSRKSGPRMDREWTTKVEVKLSKLTNTVKNLMNKLSDVMQGVPPTA